MFIDQLNSHILTAVAGDKAGGADCHQVSGNILNTGAGKIVFIYAQDIEKPVQFTACFFR
ncbi:hypothetical protein ES708_27178 [subsurface metagenome]